MPCRPSITISCEAYSLTLHLQGLPIHWDYAHYLLCYTSACVYVHVWCNTVTKHDRCIYFALEVITCGQVVGVTVSGFASVQAVWFLLIAATLQASPLLMTRSVVRCNTYSSPHFIITSLLNISPSHSWPILYRTHTHSLVVSSRWNYSTTHIRINYPPHAGRRSTINWSIG